jgi:hypothetical protein
MRRNNGRLRRSNGPFAQAILICLVTEESLLLRDRLVGGGDSRAGVVEYFLLGGEEAGLGGGQADGLVLRRPAGGTAGQPRDVVKSPQVPRRQALMLGSDTPKRVSMRRISDVWSSTSEQT